MSCSKNNWWLLFYIIFVAVLFIVTSTLRWGFISAVFGILIFVLLFVLILAWVLDIIKDKKLVQLTDIRKVEGLGVDKCKLKLAYEKDKNKHIPNSLYLSTPDEQSYINWLEEQTTKFLILQEYPTLDQEYTVDEPIEQDSKNNMEDY
jgi:energy-coupling factor transporter transmembrane protein EcfT